MLVSCVPRDVLVAPVRQSNKTWKSQVAVAASRAAVWLADRSSGMCARRRAHSARRRAALAAPWVVPRPAELERGAVPGHTSGRGGGILVPVGQVEARRQATEGGQDKWRIVELFPRLALPLSREDQRSQGSCQVPGRGEWQGLCAAASRVVQSQGAEEWRVEEAWPGSWLANMDDE